jgi:catechol 2,3-dioxygenase
MATTAVRSVETAHLSVSRLPASTHVGRVRLAVSNLERSVAFYRDVIGLAVLGQSGRLAQLGAHNSDRALLELQELPGVQPIAERSRLGLYHTAFLLPTREDLSSFVRHLWKLGVRFGAGDHAVSEALYLVDPDGLEVEVYADRPRAQWSYANGKLRMGTQAVRFETLPPVAEDSWKGAPSGTSVGHVHLYVANLQSAAEFYCAALGLDITVQIPSALFTSAGGYHHHVGLNVWAAGSPLASDHDARLLSWQLVLPNPREVEQVVDRLLRAGFSETPGIAGERAFTDDSGITVALVAESQHAA